VERIALLLKRSDETAKAPRTPRANGSRARGVLALLASWRFVPSGFLILCLLAPVPASLAEVNLSLEPASVSVSPGEGFSLQLWARSDSAQSFDGVDAVLEWDAGLVTLNGHSDDDAPYVWSVSDFLAASPLNDTWDDGDAIYTCLRPLGGTPPQTDLLITTLEFTATQSAGSANITIPTDDGTSVASGGVAVLGTTTGATVTVRSGDEDGGGGGGGGGDGGGENDGDGDGDGDGDEGGESDGDGGADDGADGGGDAGDDADGESDAGDGEGEGDGGGDGEDGGDGDGDDGEHNGEESGNQAPVGLCGAGVAEAIAMCFAALCLFVVQRPRRRVPRDPVAMRMTYSGASVIRRRARGGPAKMKILSRGNRRRG